MHDEFADRRSPHVVENRTFQRAFTTPVVMFDRFQATQPLCVHGGAANDVESPGKLFRVGIRPPYSRHVCFVCLLPSKKLRIEEKTLLSPYLFCLFVAIKENRVFKPFKAELTYNLTVGDPMAFVVHDLLAFSNAWWNPDVRKSLFTYNPQEFVDAMDVLVRSEFWDIVDTLLFTQPGLVVTCGLICASMMQETVVVLSTPRSCLAIDTKRIMVYGCLVGVTPAFPDVVLAYRSIWSNRASEYLVPKLGTFETVWSPDETYRLERITPLHIDIEHVKGVLDRYAQNPRKRRVRYRRVMKICDRFDANIRRVRAAIIIQRAWRDVSYDPRTVIGTRRLLREFTHLTRDLTKHQNKGNDCY